jgi:hypothetical protein
MLRLLRVKRTRPSCSSISLIWWLTAAGVSPSSSAARVKFRWRPAASKLRSARVPGGSWRMDLQIFLDEASNTTCFLF